MPGPMSSRHAAAAASFEIEDLDAFACGCVAARFRVLPWSGHVVRLEAKGAYCPFPNHTPGAIVGLGLRSDLVASDEADTPRVDDLPAI